MKNRIGSVRTKLLMAAIGTSCFIFMPAAASEPVHGKDEPTGITEARVFVRGDALHLAKGKMLPGIALSSSFTSKIQYPENWDWAAKGSIMDASLNVMLDAGDAKKSVTYSGPTPPGGTPPIGTNAQVMAACVAHRTGPGLLDVTYGTTSYEWTYGYRADSSNDGKMDSDPGWYLTSETFIPYQETQENPILC